MIEYYLSSPRMTIYVVTDLKGVIMQAAPIARRFVGQPLSNLRRWMKSHGSGYREERLG